MEWALVFAAALSGVLTVFAPCTLPILPAYLSFIAGVTDCTPPTCRWRIVVHGVLFVVGFSVVFLFFGVLASMFGAALGGVQYILTVLGGIAAIMFGLFMLRVLKMPKLERELRLSVPKAMRSVATPLLAVLFGAVFAVGWTPCVGPVLATVLFLVGIGETLLQGLVPLIAFLVGFSVPFIVLAYGAERMVERITGSVMLRRVEQFGGVLLIAIGVLLLVGEYQSVAALVGNVFRDIGLEALLEKWM